MADDNKPRINVTRGKRTRPKSKTSSSKNQSASSSAWGIPSGLVELSDQVADGVRDVWLAGLGALSVVEEQGSKLFSGLVEEGKAWEQERRDQVKKALQAPEEATEEAADATASASEQMTERVRDGVDAALERAGVPSRRALEDLRSQVNDLATQADQLAQALEQQTLDSDE